MKRVTLAPGLARVVGLLVGMAVGLAVGCSARDDGSSPEAAVRSLISAARDSATGDRQTVRTVREGKSWKVELPLR
jgi:hypothetical protein